MFKFKLGQEVWYKYKGSVYSAPVLSRRIVENVYTKNQRGTTRQEELFALLGNEGISYATIHGEFEESELSLTKGGVK